MKRLFSSTSPKTPPTTPPTSESNASSTPSSSPETKRRRLETEPATPPRISSDEQVGHINIQPPSIKNQRREAIRVAKQARQFPANFQGVQLLPPDLENYVPPTQSYGKRKFQKLLESMPNIPKDN